MTDDLLELVIDATGGRGLWNSLRSVRVDSAIGGPIWAMAGWPPEKTFNRVLTLDTVEERMVFTRFTRSDRQMVFAAVTDSVTPETLNSQQVDTRQPARTGFKGGVRNSAWDAARLRYFLGDACWDYFTTPFLFAYPGVSAREIEPRQEAGQAWRRRWVRFPDSITTHNPDQVFSFNAEGLQRRLGYIVTITGDTLVGRYLGPYPDFDGLQVATHRRIFRRGPDNTVTLNLPSITLDIHGVELIHSSGEQEGS